jgi:hypothetical protein
MPSAPSFTGGDRLILPADYTPTADVCIIGRGKTVREHPGNVKFNALIDSNIVAYQSAVTKGLKSAILWNILTEARKESKDSLGFVKKDPETGRWCAVDDANARINIAQAFRDRLSYSYKSSKRHKSIKRKHNMGFIDIQEDFLLNEKILASLVNMENHQYDRHGSNKRMCLVQTMANTMPSSMPKIDASVGRINSSMEMGKLRDILQGATRVTCSVSSKDLEAFTPKNEAPTSDALAKLLKELEANTETSEDPFEPKPIAAVVVEEPKPTAAPSSYHLIPFMASSSYLEKHEDMFEPLPFVSVEESSMLQSSLSLLDFSDSKIQLEDCFDLVNSIWNAQPEPLFR